MGVCWKDKFTNIEVLSKANTTIIETLIIKSRLMWIDHVIRMADLYPVKSWKAEAEKTKSGPPQKEVYGLCQA